MRIVGIDPGKDGRAVALDTVTSEAWLVKLPFDAHGAIDLSFSRWLLTIAGKPDDMVFLEKLHVGANSAGKIGLHTSFKMGFAYGQLDVAIRATLISSRLVTPAQWQKVVFEGVDQKLQAKDKAMLMYERQFPNDPIPKTPRQKKIDHNAVDALWIAEYGALKFGGGKMIMPRFHPLAEV